MFSQTNMETQIVFRYITSFLVIASLPYLFILLKELLKDFRYQKDSIQWAILAIYLTFIISGVLTLYINIQFQFFNGSANKYTDIALIRNILKQAGILFVSWWLYTKTRKGGRI